MKTYHLFKFAFLVSFLFVTLGLVSADNTSEGLIYHYEFLSLDGNGKIPNQVNPASTEAAARYGGANIVTSDFREGKSLRLKNVNGNSVTNPAVDYVLLPNNLTSQLTDFTIAVWVKLDATDTWARIFDLGRGTNYNLFLTSNGGGSGLRFGIKNVNINSNEYILDSKYGFPSINKWVHVAVTGKYTISGTQVTKGELKLYVNGEDVGIRRDNLGVVKVTPTSLGYTNQNYIGKSQYNDNGLRAYVNDFRVYNRTLSGEEIKQIQLSDRLLDYYNTLQEETIKGSNTGLTYVIHSLKLPYVSDDGNISVTWSSSDENVIIPDGTVIRPDNTTEVILSAKLGAGHESIAKEFQVTVIGKNQDPTPGETPQKPEYKLKINELMSNNVSAVLDDGYNYSMWVEVMNQGEKAVNMSMFYFSDTKTDPKKWRPSETIIKPGAYHVMWFERHDYEKHANFKLSPEGGRLYLFDLSGNVVDSVFYPVQYRNISYGRTEDGDDKWSYFTEYSFNSTNTGKQSASVRCSKPKFSISGGIYTSTQQISFGSPLPGESIYYTTNGTEPTTSSKQYTAGATITVSKSTIIRARSFADKRIPSDIVSATYLFDNNIDLPVVSIITDPANLYDNTIGIYTGGTNGIPGKGQDSPKNWNQDWSRPANFELFDINGKPCLNQELDIAISGGWSRGNGQKSLKISPRKKFGDNRLRYDIFSATKPNKKYKDILLRNSGNDWGQTMMRDAFMQSLIMHRIDLDYQAYEPAILFINGEYFGIQNLRERTNKDYLYTNYNLDEDEFYLIEGGAEIDETVNHPEFTKMASYIFNNNISNSANYENVEGMMDVDNFINYFMTQIFYGNTDWPHNNLKTWKKKENGKWRWLLFDTDFGFNHVHSVDYNTLSYVHYSGATCAKMFNRLITNNKNFQDKFIDRSSIHLSSTFQPERTIHIMDSIAGKIENQIVRHKNRWGHAQDFHNHINSMKNFAKQRPGYMLTFISRQFLNSATTRTIEISSNDENARYLFNNEKIIDNQIDLKSFQGRAIKIEAENVPGKEFKHWEVYDQGSSGNIISMKESWKYFDENRKPSSNWTLTLFDDNSWKSGTAPLGYGGLGHKTTINFGSNSSSKYPTAYFRKKVTINDPDSKDSFEITIYVDDGAAVYVNGKEIGRHNLPSGGLYHTTLAQYFNNGEYATFSVPKEILVEGVNQIAVEVHQYNLSSSDLILDLEMTYKEKSSQPRILEDRVYSGILSANFGLKAIYDVLNNNIATTSPKSSLVNLYPTLIDDYVTIENASGMTVRVVNISGMTLLETKCHSDKEKITLSNLQKGIYIVIVGDSAFKIVKNER